MSTAEILANVEDKDTGIVLVAGNKYSFSITVLEPIKDWLTSIPTPDGLATAELPVLMRPYMGLAESFRKNPKANWLALVGVIYQEDGGKSEFVIGSGTQYDVTQSGQLHCYFNDVPLSITYDNNSGKVQLTVEKVTK